VTCPVREVFYGGARGGGKTDGSLGDWLEHQQTWGKYAVGVFFRRTLVQLEDVIERAKTIYEPLGAKWHEQKKTFLFPNKARLRFRYLEKDKDAESYQGHSYTRIYIEEATNFPFSNVIDKLRATLRSSKVPGQALGIRLTGNPGGPGHAWVKKRYIDPAPLGGVILEEDFVNPFTKERIRTERVFIPAKLSDNRLLLENDPFYVANLQQSGSKQLVEAWLLGKWDIIDGAFFSEFDPLKHILPADWINRIPPHSFVFRALDWGYARPFCVGWYAVSDGTWGLPRNAMVKFQEWYGCTGRPNEGIRMDAPLVAEGVRERDRELAKIYGFRVRIGPADPSIFTRDGGPSMAEMMLTKHVAWTRADNKRPPGWQNIRRGLRGVQADGSEPLLYFLETCADTIRTLPTLQHDEAKPEDLDTESEDHAADETRYACSSRPFVVDLPKEETLSFADARAMPQIAELLAASRKKRLAASY
jgi:hypothetical protein